MARRIEQVDLIFAVFELKYGRANRDPALLFDFHPVRSRIALIGFGTDRACQVNRSAIQEELLGECRLTRIGMGDDGKGAPSGDFLLKGEL